LQTLTNKNAVGGKIPSEIDVVNNKVQNQISSIQHHHHHHHIHHHAGQSSQFSGPLFKQFSRSEVSFFEKLRLHVIDDGAFDDVMKAFFCYVEGVFNQNELFELISPLFLHEDLLIQLKNMISSRDFSRRNHNLLCKPLSEFETHYFKKISYSYFEMPKDFPRSLCFGRTSDKTNASLYKQVFNEDYSSLPQGSESFKFKIKN
jgi:histone deacetylase complex regulatory component SIN3